ncbi:MAG: biotin transporter BioY [Rickettsiaceae bacterium]|nr:biotin transporter BioY [Rickettsiaceae bacterium]
MFITSAADQNNYSVSLAKIAIGIVLISSMAQLNIPTKPVPITLQTVAVILVSLLYSPREAFITLLSYIMIGAIGAPVFSSFGSGFARIIGPSGGYLLGMLVGATTVSIIRSTYSFDLKSPYHIGLLSFMCLGILYFFGVTVLSIYIGFWNALYSGFLVFIPTGVIKTVIISVILGFINGKNT